MNKKVQVWIASQQASESKKVLVFKLVPKRGSTWTPVTGWVEKGEGLMDAAKRETEEETGLTSDSGTWVDLKFSHEFDGRWGKAEEHAFGLILKNTKIPLKLDSSELVEFKWVSFEEARKLLGFEAQRSALELFSCYFKEHGLSSG